MARLPATLLALLLVSSSAHALMRRDLTSRYGRANWSQSAPGSTIVTTEQFVPEPGIGLTAKYDDHGNVKEIRITPLGPETDERGTRVVPINLSEKLLNQVVPRKQQPAESSSGMTGACHHTTMATKDELTIVRTFSDCDPKGLNITVTWR